MKNLLIVTRKISAIGPEAFAIAASVADEVALTGDGVYNHPDEFRVAGFSGEIKALESDCEGRSVGYVSSVYSLSGLVDAIQESDKVITL